MTDDADEPEILAKPIRSGVNNALILREDGSLTAWVVSTAFCPLEKMQ